MTARPRNGWPRWAWSCPAVAPPLAAYVPALRTGNYVYTAGQLPMVDGELMMTGKVGAEVTAEEAAELARLCALNALAAVASVTGEPVRGAADSQGRRVRGQRAGLHRAAAGHQRGQRAAPRGVRRGGQARPQRGRRGRAAAGRPVEVELIAEVQ